MTSLGFILAPNEDVIFKHSTLYNKLEGLLYITSIRLAFVPLVQGNETLTIALADILKDQYSPANEPR